MVVMVRTQPKRGALTGREEDRSGDMAMGTGAAVTVMVFGL